MTRWYADEDMTEMADTVFDPENDLCECTDSHWRNIRELTLRRNRRELTAEPGPRERLTSEV